MSGVVVFSCPKYAWMRPLWFKAWERAWPDCPYPVEWVGNEANEPWGACYLRWAQKHQGAWLVMLDDYMVDEVSISDIQGCFFRVQTDTACVRLKPTPGPTLPCNDVVGCGEIDRSLAIPSGYPISLQPSVWNVSSLAWHVEPHYSPWQVEIDGSKKAPFYHGRFLGTYHTAIGFRELSVKGKIQEDTLAWVKSL